MPDKLTRYMHSGDKLCEGNVPKAVNQFNTRHPSRFSKMDKERILSATCIVASCTAT